jgi:uridine kinase
MSKTKIIAWLVPRFALGLIFNPQLHNQLFIPFIFQDNFNLLDPWSAWINSFGRSDAFPYGPIMFIFFIPAKLMFQLFALSPSLSILLTLIFTEFLIFRKLQVFQKSYKSAWYWMCVYSPLLIYITYIHGQLDAIPALGVLLSSLLVFRGSWKKSGVVLGFAIAAKFSIALIIPIFGAYFLAKKYRQRFGVQFITGLIPGLFVAVLPGIFSSGYRGMVFGTPEITNTLNAQLDLGITSIFILPIAYLIILLIFWNLQEVSRLTLVAFASGTFLVVAMFQSSSVGWFYWGLVLVYCFSKEFNSRLNLVFNLWQVSTILYFALKFDFTNSVFVEKFLLEQNQKIRLLDFFFTLNLALGLTFLVKFIRVSLKVGDIYSLSKKPLSISIAGDSGVGKDSLSNEISKLFGNQEVSQLYGDDYHLYERDNSNWEYTTHLSAHANDLVTLGKDFRMLLQRESVLVKTYDHTSGKFLEPRRISSSDLVIVNGLHALLFPASELSDLRIFMSMADDLRTEFKISRDSTTRSHKSVQEIKNTIEFRKEDYEKFVKPQQITSDLHFHVTRKPNTTHLMVNLSSRDVAFLLELQKLMQTFQKEEILLSMNNEGLSIDFDTRVFNTDRALDLLLENLPSSDQMFVEKPSLSAGSLGYMSFVSILYLAKARLRSA